MKKPFILSIIGLVAIAIIIIVVRHKTPLTPVVTTNPIATSTTATSTAASIKPVTTIPTAPSLKDQAWNVFENYLTAAKNHNLAALSSLSYQISSTCKDSSQQAACFQRMDSVYTAAKDFKEADFTHIISDSKQIILYTDWNQVYNTSVTIVARSLIYFTRTPLGTPQVLSLNLSQAEYISHTDSNGKTLTQAQIDAAVTASTTADDLALQKDTDHNGWWDSIQQYFY